jgi:hypothetical protein
MRSKQATTLPEFAELGAVIAVTRRLSADAAELVAMRSAKPAVDAWRRTAIGGHLGGSVVSVPFDAPIR